MNHNIYTVGVLPSQPWNYLGKKDLSDIFTDFFFCLYSKHWQYYKHKQPKVMEIVL